MRKTRTSDDEKAFDKWWPGGFTNGQNQREDAFEAWHAAITAERARIVEALERLIVEAVHWRTVKQAIDIVKGDAP